MSKYFKSKLAVNPLPLIIPGTQDWTNPRINPQLNQNSFISSKNVLTTQEIQQSLKIPSKYINACRIGVALHWQSCLIWHKGRNYWEIYDLRE